MVARTVRRYGDGVRIATPVYALARNDRIIAFSVHIKLVYNQNYHYTDWRPDYDLRLCARIDAGAE